MEAHCISCLVKITIFLNQQSLFLWHRFLPSTGSILPVIYLMPLAKLPNWQQTQTHSTRMGKILLLMSQQGVRRM